MKIIIAFACSGKSFLSKMGLNSIDIDPFIDLYGFDEDDTKKSTGLPIKSDNWEELYVERAMDIIRVNLDNIDYVSIVSIESLISSIRLEFPEIELVIYMPKKEKLHIVKERCMNRGTPINFYNGIVKNWEEINKEWHDIANKYDIKIIYWGNKNEYLKDIL